MDKKDLVKIKSFMIENDKGKFRIRFRSIDGSMGRVPTHSHPAFKNKNEAKDWIKSKQAYISGEKARIKRIRDNNDRYPQIQEKLRLYIEYKTEQGIKEVATIEGYFQNYILNFFLSIKLSNNIHEWSTFYPDFLKHLKTVKGNKTAKLANETQRKIVFYFNDFLSFLYAHKQVETMPDKVVVPKAEDTELTLEEAYWTEEDIIKVKPFLSTDTYKLFIFALETGMRIAEILGVTKQIYYKGELPRRELHQALEKLGILYKGYIKLDSQLDTNDGVFTLKPLKGKSKILNKHARYIPVSETCFEIVKYYNNRIVGLGNINENDSRNLFWVDLTQSKVNAEIQNACKQAGIPIKTTHSTRHTFCTNFLLKTSSEFLTKIITGHASDKAFKRYLHLIESLADGQNRNNGLL